MIDDASRFEGDSEKSKKAYEEGMYRAFQRCRESLRPDGRMVVVFANKQPDAWETLASAIIRAGFVVDESWPIQTERETRMRAYASAALASSVWLVCKKRPEVARPGWDNAVLAEMFERIQVGLREFWDVGILGPDFVWAATGPALEVYSKHPVVKKANAPGELMAVSEFLGHVRRIVVEVVRLRDDIRCQGRSKFGPLRRSKSRPVGEGVAVFVGRLERSLRSPFRAAQA